MIGLSSSKELPNWLRSEPKTWHRQLLWRKGKSSRRLALRFPVRWRHSPCLPKRPRGSQEKWCRWMELPDLATDWDLRYEFPAVSLWPLAPSISLSIWWRIRSAQLWRLAIASLSNQPQILRFQL